VTPIPRKTKSKKQDEEFEPLRQVYSPGFLMRDKKLVFEQIPHGAYAMYNLEKGSLMVAESGPLRRYVDIETNTEYIPLKRVPWPLSIPKLTFTSLEESDLWKEIAEFICDHIDVVEPELYDVLTAWIFASYLRELWTVVPYIFFYGPVATGKTRGLETMQALAYRGILGSNVSTAALFRGCDLWHPTVFLDETEIYGQKERIEVIGLLNAGYRRGQYVWRVRHTDQGSDLETFDVFGLKGLSGTEGLAKTLESRSIKIRMIKNTRPVRFLVDVEKAEELRGKLLMWRFLKLREGCERCEPFLGVSPHLKFANGRLAELFQPLLTVANDGHENIVKYAKKVYEIRQSEEETGVEAMILNALIEAQDKVEEKVILTKDIRNTLNEDIPQKERFKTTTVGKIMHRLGFLPKHTRRGNGWVWNDSRVSLLKSRYLPEATPSGEGSQGSQPSHLDPVNPNKPAERCEICGHFPVAYEFTYQNQKIRRCRACIEDLKRRGFQFTSLRELKRDVFTA